MVVRTPEPRGLGQLLLCNLPFLALLNASKGTTSTNSSDVVKLHEAMVSFAVRGQITVELFPPWSVALCSSADGLAFLVTASLVAWILIGAFFGKSLHTHTAASKWSLLLPAVYASVNAALWILRYDRDTNGLVLLNESSDKFVTLALIVVTAWQECPRWLQFLFFLGAGEVLTFVGYALGSNYVDAAMVYALIGVTRVKIVTLKLSDTKRSMLALACEAISTLSITLIVWPLCFLIISGALIPKSEAAAGGNYNLRYLSATARRSLTPFPPVPTTSSGLGPRQGTAYTLYIPGAGFLWSDPMMWKQSLPNETHTVATNQVEDETGKVWSVEGSHRVFFQDKFGERYPWEAHQVSPWPQKQRRTSSMVASGNVVRLFDPMSGRLLCIIPGEAVVSEAGYFSIDSEEEQTLSRVRVGTLPDPIASDCDWTMYYDPAKDQGLELYSQHHSCSLATTFRSLPDPKFTTSNDTVLRTLNLKLEASCTTSASPASARLFLIESTAQIQAQKGESGAHKGQSLAVVAWKFFWNARDYFDARKRLWRFRRHHAHLQEEGLGTVPNRIEGEIRTLKPWEPDSLPCCLFLAIWIFEMLSRQRRPTKNSQWPSGSHLAGIFVLCHVCAYYALGARMPHSSRVAAGISLYCVSRYVAQKI